MYFTKTVTEIVCHWFCKGISKLYDIKKYDKSHYNKETNLAEGNLQSFHIILLYYFYAGYASSRQDCGNLNGSGHPIRSQLSR
jgi:hypothetical protein